MSNSGTPIIYFFWVKNSKLEVVQDGQVLHLCTWERMTQKLRFYPSQVYCHPNVLGFAQAAIQYKFSLACNSGLY